MAYVDLNPIRAGIAATPEASEFTSICARIEALRSARDPQTVPLLSFGTPEATATASIPFRLEDYLTLVDADSGHPCRRALSRRWLELRAMAARPRNGWVSCNHCRGRHYMAQQSAKAQTRTTCQSSDSAAKRS
jgi:hypothetical protein